MTDKIVKLSRRYEAHGEVFDTVKVREPRFMDIARIGEPVQWQRSLSGAPIVIEDTEVVADYMRRCIVSPGYEALGELGVTDTRAVRKAVMDFFLRGPDSGSEQPNRSEEEQIS